jgi:hypothetical protein
MCSGTMCKNTKRSAIKSCCLAAKILTIFIFSREPQRVASKGNCKGWNMGTWGAEPVKKPTLNHQFFICSTWIITSLQIPSSKKGINSHWSKSLHSQSELIAISTTSIGSLLQQITMGK